MESLITLIGKGRLMGREGLPSLAGEYAQLRQIEADMTARRGKLIGRYGGDYKRYAGQEVMEEIEGRERRARVRRKELRRKNPVASAIVYVARKLGMNLG